METPPEGTPQITPEIQSSNIWLEKDFINLKEGREIKDEDLSLIETLASLPKSIALDHHNYYNFSGVPEAIKRDLARVTSQIETEQDEQRKTRLANEKIYLENQKQIVEKYDWTTAWNVNVVLERRRNDNK